MVINMHDLIGKTCLIKYDINLMLETIFTVTEVNEQQQWIRVTPHNRWYTLDSVLLFEDRQILNKVLLQHKILIKTCDDNREQEKKIKKEILNLVSLYKT